MNAIARVRTACRAGLIRCAVALLPALAFGQVISAGPPPALPNFTLIEGQDTNSVWFAHDGHSGSYRFQAQYNAATHTDTITQFTYVLNLKFLVNPVTAADSALNDVALVGSIADSTMWTGRMSIDRCQMYQPIVFRSRDPHSYVETITIGYGAIVFTHNDGTRTQSTSNALQGNVGLTGPIPDSNGRKFLLVTVSFVQNFTPPIVVGRTDTLHLLNGMPNPLSMVMQREPASQIIYTPVIDASATTVGLNQHYPALMAHWTVNWFDAPSSLEPYIDYWDGSIIEPRDFALVAGNPGRAYFLYDSATTFRYGGDSLSIPLTHNHWWSAMGPSHIHSWPADMNGNAGHMSFACDSADKTTWLPATFTFHHSDYDNVTFKFVCVSDGNGGVSLGTDYEVWNGSQYLTMENGATEATGYKILLANNRITVSSLSEFDMFVPAVAPRATSTPVPIPGDVARTFPPDGYVFSSPDSALTLKWKHVSGDIRKYHVQLAMDSCFQYMVRDSLVADTAMVLDQSALRSLEYPQYGWPCWRVSAISGAREGAFGKAWRLGYNPTSVDETVQPTRPLEYYPNPARNNFTLSFTTQREGRVIVDVRDALGCTVQTSAFENVPRGPQSLPIVLPEHLFPGVYAATVHAAGTAGDATIRFVLVR